MVLASREDYRESGIPNMLRVLSVHQLHKLVFVWVTAFAVLTLGCVALYLLARAGRVSPLQMPRRIGYTLAVLLLGGSTLVFAGVGLMGWLELLPNALGSTPTPATPAASDIATRHGS